MPFPTDTIIPYNVINKQMQLLNVANWIRKLVKCQTGYESNGTVQWNLYAPICNMLPEKIESRSPVHQYLLLKDSRVDFLNPSWKTDITTDTVGCRLQLL